MFSVIGIAFLCSEMRKKEFELRRQELMELPKKPPIRGGQKKKRKDGGMEGPDKPKKRRKPQQAPGQPQQQPPPGMTGRLAMLFVVKK